MLHTSSMLLLMQIVMLYFIGIDSWAKERCPVSCETGPATL